ncbi:MAG: regulatory protein GemA [Pseudomonadota bacterium]
MSLKAVINIAKAQLGLEEDDYRAILEQVTGKRSLRDMTHDQQIAVVKHLEKKGFVRQGGRRKHRASDKAYLRMVHAIWASCHRLGVIDDGSRAALRVFCARRIHGEDTTLSVDPDHMTYTEANTVLAALKSMERRGKAAQA